MIQIWISKESTTCQSSRDFSGTISSFSRLRKFVVVNFRGGKSVSQGHKVGEGQSWSCASVELLVNVKARHESYDHTNSYNILIRRVKKE